MASILSTRLPPPPSAARLADAVREVYGASAALSMVIATGGLHSRGSTIAIAERWKLVTKGAN